MCKACAASLLAASPVDAAATERYETGFPREGGAGQAWRGLRPLASNRRNRRRSVFVPWLPRGRSRRPWTANSLSLFRSSPAGPGRYRDHRMTQRAQRPLGAGARSSRRCSFAPLSRPSSSTHPRRYPVPEAFFVFGGARTARATVCAVPRAMRGVARSAATLSCPRRPSHLVPLLPPSLPHSLPLSLEALTWCARA